MAQLDIEKLRNNQHARVMISLAGRGSFLGYITGDFGFSINSNYQQLLETTRVNKLNEHMAQAQFGMNTFLSFFGAEMQGLAAKNLSMTTLSWVETTPPEFNLTFTLVNALKGDSFINGPSGVKVLYQAVLPEKTTELTLHPPLGYSPSARSATGTATIKVGQWFEASGQLITSINSNFSSVASNTKGEPLHGTVTIGFRAYRSIDYNEFIRYFKI